MTPEVLAFAAGVAGVAGGWELLSASARPGSAWLRSFARPARRAVAGERASGGGDEHRLAVLASAGLLAAGWLLGGPLLGAVAAGAGPAGVVAAARIRRRRHVTEIRRGAAPAARAMATALGAGRSVRAAIGEAAEELDGQAGRELRAAARALALGEPTATVLEDLRRKAGGGPWNTLVAALAVQREAGGDLAGLLRDLAGSLEAAVRAERDARAATAQARVTARIVAGLPLLAAASAEVAAPGFAAGLLGHPLSLACVVAAACLQLVALTWIRRIVG